MSYMCPVSKVLMTFTNRQVQYFKNMLTCALLILCHKCAD